MGSITFRKRLQARVQEKRGEKLQGSASYKCKPTIVPLARIEIGLVCKGSKCNLCVAAEEIGACGGGEWCRGKVREDAVAGDTGAESGRRTEIASSSGNGGC